MAKKAKDIIIMARDFYKKAVDADGDNRRKAMEDIKFVVVEDAQWDTAIANERGDDRLMLTFDQSSIQCKRVINEMRSNRPQGKVRGYEDNDKETAETLEGLARNIWNVSDGESISDYAAQYQVNAGYGAWEICTDYADDTAFDQDILVKSLPNPFCLWSDPSAKDMLKRDAKWWLKTEKLTKDAFEETYKDRDKVGFEDTEFDDEEEWEDDESVRIAEVWWLEPVVREIALLRDGKTVDMEKDQPAPEMIVRTRKVDTHKIMTAIVSGDAVLEGPNEWVGKYFPFVVVYGEYILVDGKTHWFGMVRKIKDAAKAFNDTLTSIVETIASAPQSKVWATAKQAEGQVNAWAEAHKKNLPMMLYNADPEAPGPPVRVGGADVPVALIQSAQIFKEQMNSLAGFMFDPAAVDAKNISGKALNARATQGQIATFNYPDNMGKAMKYTWQILIDLIPKIYDTERSVRILGPDGAEKFVKVNQKDPVTGRMMNDLSRGKYDVVVTVGPNFATQRQEAAEAFIELAGKDEGLMPTAADLVYKALDLPYSDQISERRKAMLPPPIQEMLKSDKPLPPEVQQAMMQVQQQAEMLKQQGQLVEQAAAEAEGIKSEAVKEKAAVQIAQANLKTEEAKFQTMQAQFETLVAKTQADLQKTVADIAMSEMQHETDKADAEKVGNAANMALEQITQLSEAIKSEFQDMLASAAQVVMAAKEEKPKPRPVQVRAKRVNGELVGTVTMDDGSERVANVARNNGELVGTVQ